MIPCPREDSDELDSAVPRPRGSGVADAWEHLLPHRERLLCLARRRLPDAGAAEDCVQEALLRAAQFPGLDPSRALSFLTALVIRLTADEHRSRGRREQVVVRLAWYGRDTLPGVDEDVCDHAEGRWLRAQADLLPARQRDVLLARADGLSSTQVAAVLSLTPKATERALQRARTTLQTCAAG